MPRRIIYRRQLLLAVEAFLEKTPSAHVRAQHIIQRCYATMAGQAKGQTLDGIIWHFFIQALTDSVYYENEEFLRDTREILLAHGSQNIVRTIYSADHRVSFTADEAEWYAQLVSMLDFLTAIPFATLHGATYQPLKDNVKWATILANIPEAAQAEKLNEEYMQRKALIEVILEKSPSPENVGDEMIYHLVLREVTSLLTEIDIGMSTLYYGYPTLGGTHSVYGGLIATTHERPDMTESILWAKRSLEALAGKGALFISWRLSKAATFNADALIISLH